MHRTWQLITRNWSASVGRTLASIISVALGVATVVVVTSFYETARRAIEREVVTHWLGNAHLSIHPLGAHWGSLDAALAEPIRQLDNVLHVSARLKKEMPFTATRSPKVFRKSFASTTYFTVKAFQQVFLRPYLFVAAFFFKANLIHLTRTL